MKPCMICHRLPPPSNYITSYSTVLLPALPCNLTLDLCSLHSSHNSSRAVSLACQPFSSDTWDICPHYSFQTRDFQLGAILLPRWLFSMFTNISSSSSSFFFFTLSTIYFLLGYSQLTNSVVIVSGEQWRDPAIHIRLSIQPYIYIYPFYPKRPSHPGCHNVEQKMAGIVSSVQSLSCVWLFAISRTAACQAFLSVTNSWSYVHWVSDAIQPCYPLLFPSPPTFNLSQHQGLLQGVSSSH